MGATMMKLQRENDKIRDYNFENSQTTKKQKTYTSANFRTFHLQLAQLSKEMHRFNLVAQNGRNISSKDC